MSHIQLVMYEGYMGADPEMRYTPTGSPVTNFRLGSTRQWKKDGETVKQTTWLKVTVWGSLAEVVSKYCHKGSHVIVSGELKAGENGSPTVYPLKAGGFGASYEMTAREVRMLDTKGDGVAKEDTEPVEDNEEMPFS